MVAESVRVKHQLVILNRGRKRAPNLRTTDRVMPVCAVFSCAGHVSSAITLPPPLP